MIFFFSKSIILLNFNSYLFCSGTIFPNAWVSAHLLHHINDKTRYVSNPSHFRGPETFDVISPPSIKPSSCWYQYCHLFLLFEYRRAPPSIEPSWFWYQILPSVFVILIRKGASNYKTFLIQISNPVIYFCYFTAYHNNDMPPMG